jgi:hypothetical protein
VHKLHGTFATKKVSVTVGKWTKKTEKGSMRVGYKGRMKVKLDVKGQYWYYDILELKHNHPLHLDSGMVRYM